MPDPAEPLRALADIAEAVEVLSETSFRLEKQTVRVRREASPAGSEPDVEPLLDRLQRRIYSRFYTQVTPAGEGHSKAKKISTRAASEDFLARLSQANQSRTRWEENWAVRATLPQGRIAAAKDTRTRVFNPGQYVHDATPLAPKAGDTVRVLALRESLTVQPGFYFAFGECLGDQAEAQPSVRFYWHVAAPGAIALTRLLTGGFNRFQTPFRLKCFAGLPRQQRVDAAVLYVAARHAPLAVELMRAVYPVLAGQLREATPPFTRRLAPGLALAESPDGGRSFGTHRCRLAAEGLLAAFRAGAATVEARAECLRARFVAAGVSPELPFLSRAGNDPFGLATLQL